MATPNLVPRSDAEGQIGTNSLRWAGGNFSGPITSRGQSVGLKYLVSDQATRYDMSGMPTGTRPMDGDYVFQYSPTALFLVVDDEQLGNSSGYYALCSTGDLVGKLNVYSGTGYYTTLDYGNTVIRPLDGDVGFEVYNQANTGTAFYVVGSDTFFSGSIYINDKSSGLVLILNNSGQLDVSTVTTGELFTLTGARSNLQQQIDIATGLRIFPGGVSSSIQYREGDVFAGDTILKYNPSGSFGLNASDLRGVFDIRLVPPSWISVEGEVSVSGTSGTAFSGETFVYKVYPYVTVSGIKYYSVDSITNTGTYIAEEGDVLVSWWQQTGRYAYPIGYRVVGISGSNTVYETTGFSFIDSGVNNASGWMFPNINGADLYLDDLSNLFLSGRMYINGHQVLTLDDTVSHGTSTGITFYDDSYVVKTTGNQVVSGEKTFEGKSIFNSGIAIKTSALRGPLDIGYVLLNVGEPSGLTITPTYNYAYQLWDTSGTLTFEVYAFNTSGSTTTYSSGISGEFPLSGSFDWFKVDLAWSGASGASGYKIVLGGDSSNERYRDFYIETTGTSLEYGTTGDSLIFQSPMVVGPTYFSEIDFYINDSGDLHSVKDIYCRNIYADNLTGSSGISSGWVDANYYPRSNPSGFITGINSGDFVTHSETGAFFSNPMTNAGDIIYGGSGGSPERLAIGGEHTVLHGGLFIPAYSAITEDDISLSDSATNNATTGRHGFLPVLSNVATQFLNGQGNFATPAGTANAYLQQSFNGETSINVTHNFGSFPLVQIVDASGAMLIPYSIVHNTINDFTVSLSASTSGNVLATLGSPQLNTFVSTSNDYDCVSNDYIVEVNSEKTVNLLNASGIVGKILIIKNTSAGDVTVNAISGQTIDGETGVILASYDALMTCSNGSNWLII